jgi:hypothetical protein
MPSDQELRERATNSLLLTVDETKTTPFAMLADQSNSKEKARLSTQCQYVELASRPRESA